MIARCCRLSGMLSAYELRLLSRIYGHRHRQAARRLYDAAAAIIFAATRPYASSIIRR